MTSEKQEIGTIAWFDLTVHDADRIRDFYSRVAGWKPPRYCVIQDPAGAVCVLFMPK